MARAWRGHGAGVARACPVTPRIAQPAMDSDWPKHQGAPGWVPGVPARSGAGCQVPGWRSSPREEHQGSKLGINGSGRAPGTSHTTDFEGILSRTRRRECTIHTIGRLPAAVQSPPPRHARGEVARTGAFGASAGRPRAGGWGGGGLSNDCLETPLTSSSARDSSPPGTRARTYTSPGVWRGSGHVAGAPSAVPPFQLAIAKGEVTSVAREARTGRAARVARVG
eukprot:gene14101-biopygen11128